LRSLVQREYLREAMVFFDRILSGAFTSHDPRKLILRSWVGDRVASSHEESPASSGQGGG